MSKEDDHVLLNLMHFGAQRIFLTDTNLTWPPPERIYVDDEDNLLREAREDDRNDLVFKRISMSQLTDEQMISLKCVARGAEYVYELEIQ